MSGDFWFNPQDACAFGAIYPVEVHSNIYGMSDGDKEVIRYNNMNRPIIFAGQVKSECVSDAVKAFRYNPQDACAFGAIYPVEVHSNICGMSDGDKEADGHDNASRPARTEYAYLECEVKC